VEITFTPAASLAHERLTSGRTLNGASGFPRTRVRREKESRRKIRMHY
jgi:hypothetical protein